MFCFFLVSFVVDVIALYVITTAIYNFSYLTEPNLAATYYLLTATCKLPTATYNLLIAMYNFQTDYFPLILLSLCRLLSWLAVDTIKINDRLN